MQKAGTRSRLEHWPYPFRPRLLPQVSKPVRPMTAPAPRTAWSWQEHCRHCEWWVPLFYRKPVQIFASRQGMADYVRAHPKGPET